MVYNIEKELIAIIVQLAKYLIGSSNWLEIMDYFVQGSGDEELSDWDRFCMEEYEQMMEQDEDNDENIDDT